MIQYSCSDEIEDDPTFILWRDRRWFSIHILVLREENPGRWLNIHILIEDDPEDMSAEDNRRCPRMYERQRLYKMIQYVQKMIS